MTALRPPHQVSRWSEDWLAPRLVAATLTAIVLSWLGEQGGLPDAALLTLNVIAYLAGGFYGLKSAVESLRQGEVDVDLLMILAALGAAVIGQWREGAVLLFLFSLSNVLQDYAIGRSRQAIHSLFTLYPEAAKVRRGGQVIALKISDIKIGDTVLIEPGERIPVDGRVVAGSSAIDESPITGESLPVDKFVGDAVFAGALNKQGILDVRATRAAKQTTLARIIKLVEEAQDSKAPTERFLDRFEQRYARLILIGISLFIIVPPLLGLSDFQSHFYRAMVLMTVASPCALVISAPSAFISAIAAAARNGVLFKGGAWLEQLAAVKAVAFDKTGTLTVGQPHLTDVIACPPFTAADLIRTAASVEARSEHPLGKAVVDYARRMSIAWSSLDDFKAVPGHGVWARLHGQDVWIGRISQLRNRAAMPADLANEQMRLEREGKTVMGAVRGQKWLGLIAVMDKVREEAAPTVKALKARGLAVVMLTGDNPRVAESIAAQVGIERVYAELLPHDKVDALRRLQKEYGAVAMVGDGVNDAPALALAQVGIAMGAAGTDAALETADVVLMADKIERLNDAIALSQKTKRVVWQNIAFSLAVIAVLMLSVFAVNLPLPLGVFGHEGSTVIVVLNGLVSLLLLPAVQRRRIQTRPSDRPPRPETEGLSASAKAA